MQAVSHFSSIRAKLWLGFGLILSIFSVSTAITLVSLGGVNQHVEGVVTIKQPTLLKAKNLTIHLKQATASLGFYLLTKEDQHLNDYTLGVKNTKEIIQDLKQAAQNYPGINVTQLVNSLSNDIASFEKTGQTLLQKTSSYEENFPGIAFANKHINPLNRIIMQLSSQMIMSEMEEDPDEERKELLVDLADLRYSWSQVMNGIRGYLAFRNDNNITDMNLYIDKAESLLQKLSGQGDLLTLDQADSIEQFLSNIASFKQHYQKLLEIHGSEKWRSDAWLVRSELNQIMQNVQNKLDTLVTHLQSSIQQTSNTLMEDTGSVFNLIIGLLIIGLIVGFAISWLISRSISNPITDAANTMQNIADGDGNLTKSLDQSGHNELSQLAASFNEFVAKIRNLIKQTAHSTESVIDAVAQTSDNTSQIIKRILEQEEETDQVATAMNQMATCISDVAKNASIAEEAAETANKETQNGCAIVQKTSDAIQELACEVELAEKSIQDVEQESIRIGSVLDVIKSIAEQTNLLALNAAIEAARAGEQGRGFAVVADEVRSLATRTHESTGEIQNMIQSLQSGTQHAVSVMATGREKVDINVHQAHETLQSLGAISNAVETINQMNTQIATAAEEQCAVAEEINRNICNISDSSKQNVHKASDTAETVNTLGSLAATLQSVVQQFKFSGDSGLDFSAAKSAHLAWKARLRSFLDGKESLSHSEAVSHHDCMLGKWYYAEGLSQYGDIPEMRAIEQPHQEMHKLIKDIIQYKEDGQLDQAESLYEDVSPLSTRIIQLLGQVEQTIDSDS